MRKKTKSSTREVENNNLCGDKPAVQETNYVIMHQTFHRSHRYSITEHICGIYGEMEEFQDNVEGKPRLAGVLFDTCGQYLIAKLRNNAYI